MQYESITSVIDKIQKEFGISLRDKFIDEVPNALEILYCMAMTAMNWHNLEYDLWDIGKTLQREDEFKKYDIPFKTELEVSAGLWYLIYNKKI